MTTFYTYYEQMPNSVYSLLWLLSGAAMAQTIPLSPADIKYIYDADTFFVRCPECEKGKRGVRVMGVDSPEIRGQCQAEKMLARQAKQFAVEKIRTAKTIELIPNAKRRYDRYPMFVIFPLIFPILAINARLR